MPLPRQCLAALRRPRGAGVSSLFRAAVGLGYYAGIPPNPQSQSFMGKARRLNRERQSGEA